jgi:hypothetical protein
MKTSTTTPATRYGLPEEVIQATLKYQGEPSTMQAAREYLRELEAKTPKGEPMDIDPHPFLDRFPEESKAPALAAFFALYLRGEW